jgi:hypothetical protein
MVNGGHHVAYLTCSITIVDSEGKLKLYRVTVNDADDAAQTA